MRLKAMVALTCAVSLGTAAASSAQTVNENGETATVLSRNGNLVRAAIRERISSFNERSRTWTERMVVSNYTFDCRREMIRRDGPNATFEDSFNYRQSVIILTAFDNFC